MFHEFRVSERSRVASAVQAAFNSFKDHYEIIPVYLARNLGAGVRYLAPYHLVEDRLSYLCMPETLVLTSRFRPNIKKFWEEPVDGSIYVVTVLGEKVFAFFGEEVRQKMEACGVVDVEPVPVSEQKPEEDNIAGELAKSFTSIYESMGFIPSDHKAMREMYCDLSLIAPSPLTVFLCGETGTGKEGLARAIHAASPRCEAVFYTLNCAGMNKDLIRSELFGYKKGAFTGAYADSKGIVSAADGGTLFIDEIHHMLPEGQQALLRFLDSGEYAAVGDENVKKADVRIVAATNQNIKPLVNSGQFLKDLFYRLNEFTAQILPLRERRQDVIKLSEHFAQTFATQRGDENAPHITSDAQRKLCEHDWPGNVRELNSTVKRAFTLSQGAPVRLKHIRLMQGINLNGTITPMSTPVMSHSNV